MILNQELREVFHLIPKAFIEPLANSTVEICRGLLRSTVGKEKGQIVGCTIPIGPKELVPELTMSAISVTPYALTTLLATQIAIVGGITISFYILNKKINEVKTSLNRLESKFDDHRWATIAGAIDQLRRIEEEGVSSSIWRDLGGVRQELSEAAAYHSNRIDNVRTILSICPLIT